jgi:hypothetical protein
LPYTECPNGHKSMGFVFCPECMERTLYLMDDDGHIIQDYRGKPLPFAGLHGLSMLPFPDLPGLAAYCNACYNGPVCMAILERRFEIRVEVVRTTDTRNGKPGYTITLISKRPLYLAS